MTIQRRLARAGFTLTRDYPVPLGRVRDSFAKADQGLDWRGAGDTIEPGERSFDFRIGGRDISEGTFHDGRSRYEATSANILEHVRLVDARHVARRSAPVNVGSVARVRADRRGHPVHARRA
ncbi:MAG: hypothetical protein ABI632_11620, partial [Pseudolysinimonas sp.]